MIAVPLPRRVRPQPVAFRRLRRQRIDAKTVRGELTDADRRVHQRGEDVQRTAVLRLEVTRRRRRVVLVEVETVPTTDHAPAVARQVVGEAEARRDVLPRRLRQRAVRIADVAQQLHRRVVRPVLLVEEVDVGVIADAQVQRQLRVDAPVILEPRHRLPDVLARLRRRAHAVHRAAVGLLPLPDDARCLEALRIAAVAVADDDRRVVEERQRDEVLVVVVITDVPQRVVIAAEPERVTAHQQ